MIQLEEIENCTRREAEALERKWIESKKADLNSCKRPFAFKGYKIRWDGEGLKEVGLDQNNIIRITINTKYYRPCEVDLLLGDASKAEKELGWKREFDTLDKLIEDMFL